MKDKKTNELLNHVILINDTELQLFIHVSHDSKSSFTIYKLIFTMLVFVQVEIYVEFISVN